jgi:tRNA dimethylallyltransferase
VSTTKTLIALVGPTGVGKSDWAIELAQVLNTSIVSADSRQVFKELSIGTGAISHDQQKGIPHYFMQDRSIVEPFNAGVFETEALACLEQEFKTKDTVILCGGTGLYVQALLYGLDELPSAQLGLREELNQIYKREGLEALHELLKGLNIPNALKIDLHNPIRVIRRLEILLTDPDALIKKQTPQERPFNTLLIGLNDINRDTLYSKINQRVFKMIENGWLNEAQSVYPYKDLNPLNTVGYKELFDYLEGKLDWDTCIHLIQQHTRNYAKRQITFFKKMPSITWFDPNEKKELLNLIIKTLAN